AKISGLGITETNESERLGEARVFTSNVGEMSCETQLVRREQQPRPAYALLRASVSPCLVWFLFELGDSFVDWLASRVAFVDAVPVRNIILAHLPAEQDRIPVHYTREVEQTHVEIFHLNSGGIDFCDDILDPLNCFVTLGSSRSCFSDFYQQTSG